MFELRKEEDGTFKLYYVSPQNYEESLEPPVRFSVETIIHFLTDLFNHFVC